MIIYTDGATSNNGQAGAVGGWAYIVVYGNSIVYECSGHIEDATNNICELTAIIEACKKANYMDKIHTPTFHVIYSDSAYCVNCYKQKWYKKWQRNGWLNSKKQPVANRELWEQLIPFFENSNFEFRKVEGHSTNEYNNYVDKLAVAAKEMKTYS